MPFGKGQRPSLAAQFGIQLIEAYRISIALWLGGNCRFSPSCSVYGQQALQQHGALRGLSLILLRLLRCHPWHQAAFFDPVPQPTRAAKRQHSD